MIATRALAAVVLLGCGLPAMAGDRLLLSGGEWADTAYYVYAGTALPLGTRRDGRGFVQRYWLDYFGYEYDNPTGRIEAEAYGAEAALGHVWSGAAGWGELSAGLRYTDTDLTPDDPAAAARGRQLGGKLQFQGERVVGTAWRAGLITSWANQQNNAWGRVRLTRAVGARRAAGVEAIAWRNDEGESLAAGLVTTVQPIDGPWSVGLRAGYRWQEEANSAYAGLELGYAF